MTRTGRRSLVRLSWTKIRARTAAFGDNWRNEAYMKGVPHSVYREAHHTASQSRHRKEKKVMTVDAEFGRIQQRDGFVRRFSWARFCVSMKRLTVSLVVSTSVLLAEAASAESVTDYDRFRLWNNCQPMDLMVGSLSKDVAQIGLTKEKIAISVRSRLRAARLYDMSARPFLYVNVLVVGRAFGSFVEYNKIVTDRATGEENAAATWSRHGTGTHGGDAGYILSATAEHMDRFIDEYLRVNEDACRN